MSLRLDLTDWPQQARLANWCVRELTRQCNVSVRTLERWFRDNKGSPPHKWMQHERLSHAMELLLEGASVKETASRLGYKTQQHFSRDFKKHYGCAAVKYIHRLMQIKTGLQTNQQVDANRHNLARLDKQFSL